MNRTLRQQQRYEEACNLVPGRDPNQLRTQGKLTRQVASF
jgi:hypothetical protein